MTDNEIREAYFVARGWVPIQGMKMWKRPDEEAFAGRLPDILESYSDFKREVLEVMEGEGYSLVTHTFFNVCEWRDNETDEMLKYGEIIKDNHILRAAVIASICYWESEKYAEGS